MHDLSPNTPNHLAAFVIPFSNGIQWALNEGNVGLGKTLVIQVPGQQGLAGVIASKAAGASCIIVTGLPQDESDYSLLVRWGPITR